MILIISFVDNPHVHAVTRHLSSDHEVVDLAWFPSRMTMHACASAEVDALYLDLPSGRRVDLDTVGAVWHRRVRPLTLDPALVDDTARTFAWSESTEALGGLWPSMDCFWMNPPAADERALRKVTQLRVARGVGLAIPDTLVTNGPEAAHAFIERHGPANVIRKAFRNIPQAPRETLRLAPEHLAQLDSVRFAPVIFQEFVPVALDLRVTVVDGELFATSFRSEARYEADYRPGIGTAEVRPYDLPDDVSVRLLALMERFELRFGAVDFRLTPSGEHVFLEVNPAGEYLFASERTGQPIPQAIAAALERRDRAARRGTAV